MAFVLVVVILDRTSVFQVSLVFVTTVEKEVPAGISLATFEQACSLEIHEMPTREEIAWVLKVNRPPTAVLILVELALVYSSTLPASSVLL